MKDNALSPVLGFVLVFAIIVAVIGIIQTLFVPTWIKSVEAKHYFSLKSKFEELVEKAVDAANGGISIASFDLTLNYPRYPFLLTPAATSSSITVKKIGIINISSQLLSNPIQFDLLSIEFEPSYNYLDVEKEIMILGDYFTKEGKIIGESILYDGNNVYLVIINISEGTYAGKERIILYGNPSFTLNSANVTIKLNDNACSQYGWYLDFASSTVPNSNRESCSVTFPAGKLTLVVASSDEGWSVKLAEKLANSSFTISNESESTALSTDPNNPTIIDVPGLPSWGGHHWRVVQFPTFYVVGFTGYSNQPVNITLEWNWNGDSLTQNFVWYTLSNGYLQFPISPPAISSQGVSEILLNITLQFPDNSTKEFYVKFE